MRLTASAWCVARLDCRTLADARRLPDWRERLAAFIARRRTQPFVWGASDCCLLAADAALAITGHDYAAPLRGYDSAFGAARRLLELGHRDVASYLDTILPRAARPLAGDVVFIAAAPVGALLVFDRVGGAWGQDAEGLRRFRIPRSARFWSVA